MVGDGEAHGKQVDWKGMNALFAVLPLTHAHAHAGSDMPVRDSSHFLLFLRSCLFCALLCETFGLKLEGVWH